MKKIISKILIIFIIVIMMFEFIFPSNICHALEIEEEFVNSVTNLAGGIASIVYWPKRITAVALSFVIDLLTAQLARDSGINSSDGLSDLLITPFDIFFNKYKLLDINFFDLDGVGEETIVYTFRTTVANWYYIMRLIAMIILLVILIYVGIRMALSTIADDKAKYKKMLVDWCCSLVLIFILHYIAIFIIYCNNAIVDALRASFTDLNAEKALSSILVDIGLRGVLGVGIVSIAAVLVFVFIVFQTVAFLLAYINRVIKIGFLIMISPLISLTYSIDKMGDGKAQALGSWLKEFVYTILIQPFHCLMYMAFVRPALTLLTENTLFFGDIAALASPEYSQLVNGILAILCLKFINDGEKIVRKIFGFQDDNSTTSMAAGMAVGMLAVKNAQKMGASARKGITFAKNTGNRLGTAFKNDITKGKFGNGRLATKLNEMYNPTSKAGIKRKEEKENKRKNRRQKISGVKNKLPWNRLKETASKGGIKGYLAGKTLQHNSLSSTLGLMGAAMAYSTGSTDAFTAIGTGTAIQKGTQELFSTSKNTLAEAGFSNQVKEEEKAEAKLDQDIKDTEESLDADNVALNKADEYDELIKKSNDSTEEKQLLKKAERSAKGAESFETQAQKARDDGNEKKAKQLEKQAQLRREREKELREQAAETESAQARKKAKEMDEESEGRLSQIAIDKIGFESKMTEKKNKLGKLKEEKSNFHSAESIAQRVHDRNAPSSKELQNKKNEIVQRLIALKKADKAKQENNPNQDVKLTMDEEDSINSTATAIIDEIASRASMPGSGITEARQMSFVKEQLGLSGDNQQLYRDLFRSTSDYESMERNKEYAGIVSNASQLGIGSDKMNDEVIGRLIEYHNRKK